MSWLWNSPKIAALVVALFFGRIDATDDLIRICMRESRCRPVGIHKLDSPLSHRGWLGQVKLGHLDPKCQPEFGCEEKTRICRERWASRGAWGLSASSHWKHAYPCFIPELFDVPLFSAVVAMKKWLTRCDKQRTSPWCG